MTEPELTEPREGAYDTFLLAEEVLPGSPIDQVQLNESDIEGVLVLDDDEKSDWSEIEN